MSKKSLRSLAALMILLIVLSAITGCSTNKGIQNASTAAAETTEQAKPTEPPKKVKLTFAHYSPGDVIKKVKQAAVDRYMNLNPNVEIEVIVKSPDYGTWLKAQFAAGTAPDILTYADPQDLLYFDPKNNWTTDFKPYLEKVNKYTQNKPFKEDFFPEALEMSRNITYDNYNAGVPQQYYVHKIVYNKKLFADAGITKLPETWNEMVAVSDKLKEKNVIAFGTGFIDFAIWFDPLFSAVMDQVLGSKLKDVDVIQKNGFIQENEMAKAIEEKIIDPNDPNLKKAFKFYLDYLIKYSSPDALGMKGADVLNLFYQNKIAMIWSSSSTMPLYTKNNVDWGVFDYPILTKDIVPSSTEELISTGGPANWTGISKACADKGLADTAADFIMSYLSPDTLKLWVDAFGPPYFGPGPYLNEKLKEYADSLNKQVPLIGLKGRVVNFQQSLSPVGRTYSDNKTGDAISKEVQTYVAGKIDFDELYNKLVKISEAKRKEYMTTNNISK